MISDKVKKQFGAILNVGYIVGYVPYKYIARSGKVVFDPRVRTKAKLGCHLGALVIYEIFLIVRYLQRLVNGNSSDEGKIRGMFLCSLYLFLNINHYISLSRYGSYHFFINEFMEAVDKLDVEASKLGLTPKDESAAFKRSCEKRILWVNKFGFLTCAAMSILRAVKVFARPRSSEIPTSVFNDPEGLPIIVKLLLGIVQMNLTSFHSYIMFLHGAVMNVYINVTLPIFLGMRIRHKRASPYYGWRIAPQLRSINTQLRILQDRFNGAFKLWPLALELNCGMISIVRLFLAVKLDSAKDFLVAISVLLLVIILFRSFAEIFDFSKEALKTWKVIRFPLWFRKYTKACHPVSIHVGNFFFADKRMVLTVLTIIITNSTSLILAFKDFGKE